jgi:hypothetical protein
MSFELSIKVKIRDL